MRSLDYQLLMSSFLLPYRLEDLGSELPMISSPPRLTLLKVILREDRRLVFIVTVEPFATTFVIL